MIEKCGVPKNVEKYISCKKNAPVCGFNKRLDFVKMIISLGVGLPTRIFDSLIKKILLGITFLTSQLPSE